MDENAKTNRQKRRQKKRTQWEKLRESPIIGITTLESGGLVSTPISGKALGGRLGRRIGGGDSGPQDMNPMTARDSDLDGMVLEGIPTIRQGRGVPDPTPGGEIAGNMAREQNVEQFVGLPQLLRQHFAQFAKFQEWTRNKDWRAFHRNHFDWWMFPIPRGSNSYQDEYNIAGEPLEELKNNMRYMATLPAAMRMYMRSIGWDLDNQKWIDDADIDAGQEPIRSLNRARLYKIAQSAEAHDLIPELRSVSRMVNDLRSNGISVGNDGYWDGIAGKMAGDKIVDYNKDFPKDWDRRNFGETWKHPNGILYAFNGKPTGPTNGWQPASTFFDLREVPLGKKKGETRELTAVDKVTKGTFTWDGSKWVKKRTMSMRRDKASGGGASGSLNSERRPDKAQNFALKPGTEKFKEFFERLDMLSDWRDEASRILAVRRHRAKPGSEKPDSPLYQVPVLRAETDNQFYKDFWSLLRPLGIWVEKKKGGHENVGAGQEKWFEQPSTPGDFNSNIVSFSKVLQHLNEEVNPELFYTHFENWIRNPYSVVKTPSGDFVGVRKYYDNDREQMLAEYRRRVADLYIAAFKGQGESPPERILESLKQSQVNDWLELKRNSPYVNNLLTNGVNEIIAEGITPRSKDRLAALLSVRLQSRLNPEMLDMLAASDSLIETMLAEEFPKRDWGRDEKFFAPDILPFGDDDTIEIVRELGEQFLYKIKEDKGEIPSEITDEMSEGFIDLIGDDSINKPAVKPFLNNVASEISGQMGAISGKMGSVPERDTEAANLGYNPDVPEHLGNHFTSRHSGYDKRPDPVDTPTEARATGAPLKGLVPGDYHPDIQELINEMIDKVIEDNFHTQFQTTPMHYIGATSPEEKAAADRASDFRAFLGDWSARVQSKLMRLFDWSDTDFELTDDQKFLLRGYLSDEDISKITRFSQVPTTYTDRYGTHDMSVLRSLIGGQIPSGMGVSVGSELQEISDGLAQRAIHAGLKINNLRRLNVSDINRATEDTLEWWNDSLAAALVVNNADEEIGNAWDSLPQDINISIGMPLEGIMSMLRDGEFKTLFETRTSKGNSNLGARQVAEFAMFGILPSYRGKRPAYGIVNYGPVTRDALDRTHQYGPFVIVLKKDVNSNATWTESDSLSLMSTSSSLDAPSQHSLFQQRQTLDVPFLRITPAWGGRGKPTTADGPDAIGQFQFAEAQLHRPITVDDIAHIIIDTDAWYRAEQYINFPVTREDGFPIAETDPEYAEYERLYPQDLANYDGIIQISKIAASLNIPVLLTDELDAESGEEKYGPEYL
jgi:hypothetical protein